MSSHRAVSIVNGPNCMSEHTPMNAADESVDSAIPGRPVPRNASRSRRASRAERARHAPGSDVRATSSTHSKLVRARRCDAAVLCMQNVGVFTDLSTAPEAAENERDRWPIGSVVPSPTSVSRAASRHRACRARLRTALMVVFRDSTRSCYDSSPHRKRLPRDAAKEMTPPGRARR